MGFSFAKNVVSCQCVHSSALCLHVCITVLMQVHVKHTLLINPKHTLNCCNCIAHTCNMGKSETHNTSYALLFCMIDVSYTCKHAQIKRVSSNLLIAVQNNVETSSATPM